MRSAEEEEEEEKDSMISSSLVSYHRKSRANSKVKVFARQRCRRRRSVVSETNDGQSLGFSSFPFRFGFPSSSTLVRLRFVGNDDRRGGHSGETLPSSSC